MIAKRLFAFAALAAIAACTSTAHAGKFNKALSVGDAAPAFSGLPGVDDKTHSLDDYEDAKAIVVIFTCNHCPVARSYEARLVELQKKYEPKGVQFVAVSVSTLPADKLPAMKARAEESNYNFPYLSDESQAIGLAYGATNTPQVFVLDGRRHIAYMGAIDDYAYDATKVKVHYLGEAIEAVLATDKLEVSETRPMGCAIVYD
jgi:peroxiredoxin